MFLTKYAAICFVGTLAMVSAQTDPVQVGAMRCILETSTGIMKATMKIFKKTATVTRTFFTEPSAYDFEYSDSACQWTGDGTDSNPFTAEIEIDSETNLPPIGKRGCGYKIIDAQKQIYRWTAYNQVQHEYGRAGDVVVSFECSGKGTPDAISVEVKFNATDSQGVAQRVKPENQMSVLERSSSVSSNFGQVVTDSVSIGQQVKLRIETKVKVPSLRQAGIEHYGVFGFYCDYRVGDNGSPVVFIQQNGCANGVFREVLGTGYKFAQFTTANSANEKWFQTETDEFVLVSSIPSNDYYYIRCYVGYCYGTEGSDFRCTDFCGNNARSRRSLSNITDFDSVSIRVNVNNQPNTQNGDQSTERESEKQTGLASEAVIIIIASIVAVLLFLVLVAVAVVCCRHMQRRHSKKQWTDTSTTDSRRNLSFQTYPHQYSYPKF